MSYTPGPWGCGKTPAGWYEVFPKQHNLICLATRIAHEADAYIIATAPDMVESLQALIEYCEDYAIYLKTLGPEFRNDYLNLKNEINEAAGILHRIDGRE